MWERLLGECVSFCFPSSSTSILSAMLVELGSVCVEEKWANAKQKCRQRQQWDLCVCIHLNCVKDRACGSASRWVCVRARARAGETGWAQSALLPHTHIRTHTYRYTWQPNNMSDFTFCQLNDRTQVDRACLLVSCRFPPHIRNVRLCATQSQNEIIGIWGFANMFYVSMQTDEGAHTRSHRHTLTHWWKHKTTKMCDDTMRRLRRAPKPQTKVFIIIIHTNK